MAKKDYCTWFPESVREIKLFPLRIEKVDISGCCKIHDNTCSTTKFYKCLRTRIDKVPSVFIAIGGGLGCWVKYTTRMFRKV